MWRLIHLCQLQVDKKRSVSLVRRRSTTVSSETNNFPVYTKPNGLLITQAIVHFLWCDRIRCPD